MRSETCDRECWKSGCRYGLLWPYEEAEHHRAEAKKHCANPAAVAFLARDDQDRVIGFADGHGLRHDYVNGCNSSPVGFSGRGSMCAKVARRRA